jgi:hypothetical protein
MSKYLRGDTVYIISRPRAAEPRKVIECMVERVSGGTGAYTYRLRPTEISIYISEVTGLPVAPPYYREQELLYETYDEAYIKILEQVRIQIQVLVDEKEKYEEYSK